MIFEHLDAIDEVKLSALDGFAQDIVDAAKPIVLKGFVAHWDIVDKAKQGERCLQDYLLEHYNGKAVHLMEANEKANGRLFYNEDLTGFNFTRKNLQLNTVFDDLNNLQKINSKATKYVGSTAIDSVFPSLRANNELAFLKDKALASIWMGNQSRIAAHYDAPDNLACIAGGRRRFTLFPPEQINNLYVGPVDYTPAGQPASLVDFHAPDFEKYPRFKQALAHAQVAVLEAGDAIYIPANWWHHIEALDNFNVLINYWWRQVDDYIGVPQDALLHAMLAIKSLPQSQRDAWRALFEYYIFEPNNHDHIPAHALGILADTSPNLARKLRAMLMNKLNR